jgi:hypothetical protein
MSNDETKPLPAEGPAPADDARVDGANGSHGAPVPSAPPSPWATTQPVVPAAPSPYGPPTPGQYGPAQAPSAQPSAGRPDVEPDPWVDVTPARPGEAPAFAAPAPRPPAQSRRVLGVIGLVVAGAVAGALIVNAVDGFGGSTTAAVQPGAVSQNGTAPNGVAPGGVQGGAPGGVQGGVQGGVPGGQGLRGGPGGQGGEQRLTGTLTAVSGSEVTVRTSSGPATYQLVPQTQIVRDGALASASELETGDRVLMHVFPADGSDGVLERLIAVSGTGTSGTQGTQDDDDTADT